MCIKMKTCAVYGKQQETPLSLKTCFNVKVCTTYR